MKGVILYLKFLLHFWSYYNSLKITVQLRSVTEVVPRSLFLRVNRSPIRYSFRAGANAIQCSENTASANSKISTRVILIFYSEVTAESGRLWLLIDINLYISVYTSDVYTGCRYFTNIHCLK